MKSKTTTLRPLPYGRSKYFPLLIASALFASCAVASQPLLVETLAEAMTQRPVVLLGEVHDNIAQHAVRADAMQRLLAGKLRPAIAFEQFDRERQGDIDRARAEPLAPGASRIDHLIERAGGSKSWNWQLYRPYLRLALEYELPIVAANLSRAAAMRVAEQGFAADPELQVALGLDQLPPVFMDAHERAVESGHCGLMPTAMLPALARAQIARDLTLASAIRPHFGRGVILLAGNGHVRNDIGVPFFLTANERARVLTIGLLEVIGSGQSEDEKQTHFDLTFFTPSQPRTDPCEALRNRSEPAGLPSK